MKKPRTCKYELLLTLLVLFAGACGSPQPQEAEVEPPPAKALVDTTSVTVEDIRQEERFTASSYYPESNKLSAPIAGFLLRSPQEVGEKVGKGQVLFTIETKEHRAINANAELKKTDLASLGVISVPAPANGVLLSLDQRQGDFVSEGATLCTLALSNKLGFRLSVPYEFNAYVKLGTNCIIELPDKTRFPGRIDKNLSTSVITSQTQTFLVKPLAPMSVPEGLNVSIIVQTEQAKQAVLLPKEAVLSNETLDEFWVMKLLDDSTAVKVAVTLGISREDAVQVISPKFSAADRILTEGNFGLADTALVQIKTPEQ